MKLIKSILLISLFAYILSGCTYWTMSENNKPRAASSTKSIAHTEYSYEDDVSDYKNIILHLDIDVSDIIIKKASDQKLILTQQTSEKKAFVIPTSTPNGDTLELSFNSPKNAFNFNNLTSDITIELPEDVLYSIDTTIDVGQFDLQTSDLNFTSIITQTNVGDIDVILHTDQPLLTYVSSASDVGQITTKIDGDADVLKEITLSSNVGDLSLSTLGNFPSLETLTVLGCTGDSELSMDGIYKNPCTLDINSDIGSVSIDLKGQYADKTLVNCNTSMGDVNLKIDQNIKAKIIATENESGSKIKFKNIKNSSQSDVFFINDADSNQFNMMIEADSDVGDIEISQ